MSKVFKSISFASKSDRNHVSMKVKSLLGWLKSGHEVRVRIEGKADRHKAMEDIYDILVKDISNNAKVLQKVVKPESIKFTLAPTPESAKLVVEENLKENVDSEIGDLMKDKDIFSEDFEKQLLDSIKEERNKKKKR